MPLLLGNTASAGAAEVVTAGLITHLDASKPASYTSGSTWFDISGNGNNASINNGASYSSGNGGYFNSFVSINSFFCNTLIVINLSYINFIL
jgi:hypothetical protein